MSDIAKRKELAKRTVNRIRILACRKDAPEAIAAEIVAEIRFYQRDLEKLTIRETTA